jgi:hypothetical protein
MYSFSEWAIVTLLPEQIANSIASQYLSSVVPLYRLTSEI